MMHCARARGGKSSQSNLRPILAFHAIHTHSLTDRDVQYDYYAIALALIKGYISLLGFMFNLSRLHLLLLGRMCHSMARRIVVLHT